jgi:hypothetical protein
MAGMGPAPKPADRRARRNASLATTQLPAEGRTGPSPRWPLAPNVALAGALDAAERQHTKIEELLQDDPTPALIRQLGRADERIAILRAQLKTTVLSELQVWFELWRTPQAVMWERLGWTHDVAQYARWQALGESGDLNASKEARQLGDRLGLTPLALLRLRWEILEDASAPTDTSTKPPSGARSRYGHLRPVQAGETAPGA